jgi:membrane-associated protease RseP (regulator of RpoE activity)
VTALAWTLGVVVFVVGIGASIALHEIGHLVPAKKFGVKVTQYMVGFGPTMWSRHRGETEYGVKWIPLGGYIRMIGMFPPKPGTDPRFVRSTSTGRMGLLVESARQQSLEEIQPGDEQRVFYKLSVPRKVVVMLGGPTMNLVIAAVLLVVTMSGLGVQSLVPTVSSVSKCVLPAGTPDRECTPTDQAAPAAAAGLRPGDRLVSFDGHAIRTWDDATHAIRGAGGRTVDFVVERDGQRLDLSAAIPLSQRPVLDDNGQPVTAADGSLKTTDVGFLGVSPTVGMQRQPVTAVPGTLWDGITQTAAVVVRIPQKMVGIVQAAFGSGARDPNGPISVVGVTRAAGEIASSDSIPFVQTPRERVSFFLSLLASLNLALFVFNLIPLLPLDGGHVAGALWEGLRRAVARVRRRPDPGPADVARLLPIAYAMSTVLIVMSVLLIYADIVKPVRFGG